MEGIVSGSFLVFGCMLLGSVFFGRIFCGWLCSMGGLQECISCEKCNKSCPIELNVVELGKKSCDLGMECIQCGSCVDYCPKKALSYGWKRRK